MSNQGALKHVTKERLEELYWRQRLSLPKVATLLNVTVHAVAMHMEKHDVPFRTISEAKKGKPFYNRTGKYPNEETRQKLSEAHRKNPTRYWLGKTHSHETKRKLSEMLKGEKGSFFGRHHSEETKKLISEKARQRWRDPEFARRVMSARNIRPNKAEQALDTLLSAYFPKEYEYTGDGSLIIKGMIPDFVNCNGKKEIIELFGTYFHSDKIIGDRWYQSELGRIMAFNSFGFRCLVIWENELKDTDKLLEKIRTFQGKRR